MAEKVYLSRQNNSLIVKFHYNEDLVEIMRELNGWYLPKLHSWQFPKHRFEEIKQLLRSKFYEVRST